VDDPRAPVEAARLGVDPEGVEVERAPRPRLHAARDDDLLSGREEPLDRIARERDDVGVDPEDPLLVGEGAGEELVARSGEDRPPLTLDLRSPARSQRMKTVVALPRADAAEDASELRKQAREPLERAVAAVALEEAEREAVARPV